MLTEEDKQAMRAEVSAALAAAQGGNGQQVQVQHQPHSIMTTAQLQPTVMTMGGMMPASAMQPAAGQFMTPAAQMGPIGGAIPQPTAVLFRAKVPLPDGREVPVYIQFGPEVWGNLPAFTQQLIQVLPIDAYQPRQQNGFGGGWGGQNRQSWGNNGGGRGGFGGGNYGRRW